MILTVNVLAVVNVLVLFALLFFRKNNALPNKILALVFLIPGIYFVNTICIVSDFVKVVPISLFFVQMIAVCFPVIIYFYFSLLLGKGSKKNVVLFSGSVVLLIYILILAIRFSMFSEIEKTTYIASLSTENYPFDLFLYTVFFYAWQLVYFSVITKDILRYKKKLDDNLSNLEQVQFFYLQRFIFLLWFFTAILVGFYMVFPLYLVDYIMLPIFVNVLYFFILYISNNYNAVFTAETFEKLTKVNQQVNIGGLIEGNSFVPTEKHYVIYHAISNLLDKEKSYCDTELSVKLMSSRIGEPEYMVSQSINHFYKKTFFDLINERRIDEAKCRLSQMKTNETVEGIAYETGFNSRSAFYRAFKKYTGKTPQQLIKTSK